MKPNACISGAALWRRISLVGVLAALFVAPSSFAQSGGRLRVQRSPTIRFSPCPVAIDAPPPGRTGERWPGGRPTLVETYLRRANAEMQRLSGEAVGRAATEIEADVSP